MVNHKVPYNKEERKTGVENFTKAQCPLLSRAAGTKRSYYFLGDVLINTYQINENDRGVELNYYPQNLTHGARQAGLYIYLSRTASYVMGSSWDGNPDCAVKIQARNYAACSTSYGAVRALDINARCRSTGTMSWVNCIYATAEIDGAIDTAYVAHFVMKCSGTGSIATAFHGLRVQDVSVYVTPPSDFAMLYLYTGSGVSNARDSCIKIETHASDVAGFTYGIRFSGRITSLLYSDNSNQTNLLKVSATGKGGVTVGSDGMTKNPESNTEDGYITVAVGSTAYQIPIYAA